jgi:isoleucyl-tRNA synthetase
MLNRINDEQLYEYFLGTLKNCGMFLLDCNAQDIEYFIFEEFDSDLFVKNSKPKQEFILETADGMTVVLDTTLNEELINEGILREIIRNAQVLRKEADFNIDDRIEIYISSKDKRYGISAAIFSAKVDFFITSTILVKVSLA